MPGISKAHVASLERKGVKLPKLDVPKFDGSILNWRSFWEQFCVAVHDRTHLSDSEKLVYLQQSLKGGSAKSAVEGLSRSGEYYAEAVECLQACYNRLRLILQTHVRMILEAPQLVEGSGKELCKLHDTVQQHLCAFKAMDCEAPGPFITSVLELKLDPSTMFEWQKHSQESTAVPHYELLEFINLRTQASKSLPVSRKGSTPSNASSNKKPSLSHKLVASFTANASDLSPNCVVCKMEKHPLYACEQFKHLPHDQKIGTLKTNGFCMNCLKPGHFIKQCKYLHHCKLCQKPHHMLLHIDNPPTSTTPSPGLTTTPNSNSKTPHVSATAAASLAPNSLLMTCRVLVEVPDGSTVNATALLDSASSASFVSERLVKSLCLPCLHQSTTICGVAGLTLFNLSPISPSHLLELSASSTLQPLWFLG